MQNTHTHMRALTSPLPARTLICMVDETSNIHAVPAPLALHTPPTPIENGAMVKVYRALGEPTRLQIVQLLAGYNELACSEMVARLGVTPSTLSHHLALLTDCGLLAARKDGTFHRYRLRRDALAMFAPAATRKS